MPYEMEDIHMGNFADIRVIGVGGGGNNAVNRMIEGGLQGVRFVAVNTDAQALSESLSENKVQIGERTTGGLGAGANPQVGQESAEESTDDLKKIVEGADLLFITAGMGGGTGTGASHVIAKIAKDLGILTIAVVTRPFAFEGKVRASNSDLGIRLLREHVDALVVIPNEKLLTLADKNTTFKDALKLADDVLSQGVRGICDLIGITGIVNLDFSDVKTIMKDAGMAHMGVGYGTGEDKAVEAVTEAVKSPLLETSIKGATGVIINITGGEDLSLFEINKAAEIAREEADPDANVIFGAAIDPSLEDSVKITIIATGFNMKAKNGQLVDIVEEDKDDDKEQPVKKKESKNDWGDIPDFLKDSLSRRDRNDFE
ncbi:MULTISPECIES: cell division protein FtsZ [Anaerofustis]|uniref:cell division protein FtsZ n=1 Tax=Anaerofustis TaxID=264995 RepID=UPI001105B2AD|nr:MULTISPECIES: cell division protein FtsZ [Anaerofustis]MCO8193159.1 cell division protein FtsZ [Anaerofustis sp. NSJ-163]